MWRLSTSKIRSIVVEKKLCVLSGYVSWNSTNNKLIHSDCFCFLLLGYLLRYFMLLWKPSQAIPKRSRFLKVMRCNQNMNYHHWIQMNHFVCQTLIVILLKMKSRLKRVKHLKDNIPSSKFLVFWSSLLPLLRVCCTCLQDATITKVFTTGSTLVVSLLSSAHAPY